VDHLGGVAVIGVIHEPRGEDVAGLIYYLYGPGRHEEHTDPHIVTGWRHPAELEPPLRPDGTRDFRKLIGLLKQPHAAMGKYGFRRPVWHLSMRAAPRDKTLSDEEWTQIARDVMNRTGLSPDGEEDDAVRWIAVTAPADRTASRRPTRAETGKAARRGLDEPPRVTLRRHVSTAAAGAGSEQEFFALLGRAGVLVRPRYSAKNPGQITGYAVALPGDTAGDGGPVWYGGGKLAADLTWPKLRQRWGGPSAGPFTAAERQAIWEHAARAAEDAAAWIRLLGGTDPAAAADAAWAASDTLHVAAAALGSRILRQAADAYDRAARAPFARIPAPTPAGNQLRRAARLITAFAYLTKDPSLTPVVLLTRLAALAEAVAGLRETQQHAAQAASALQAARQLHAAASAPAAQAARQPARTASPAALAGTAFPRTSRPPRPDSPAPGPPRPGPRAPAPSPRRRRGR
jgi:hypothetical protein